MTRQEATWAARPARGLRGGWIAKRGKQVITAPAQWGCVGLAAPRPLSARIALSTSALALGLALGTGGVTPAAAGSCVPVASPDGSLAWLCSGPADPTNDASQTITVTSGNSGTISTAPGFGIEVISTASINLPSAIEIRSESGSNDIAFTDNNQSTIIGRSCRGVGGNSMAA